MFLHANAEGSCIITTSPRGHRGWVFCVDGGSMHFAGGRFMEWTKPEFTVVAVTMEVTAYAATK